MTDILMVDPKTMRIIERRPARPPVPDFHGFDDSGMSPKNQKENQEGE